VRRAAVISLVPVLVLAACGGGGKDKSTASTAAAPAATATAPATGTAPAPPAGAQQLGHKPKVVLPTGALPSKLVVKDLVVGTGATAKAGDTVSVHYVGVSMVSRKQFDASWDRHEPFTFQLGAGMVIPAWDQGVVGMKVNGRRELIVPPDLGYGAQGQPPAIAPNDTLVFVIDLLRVQSGSAGANVPPQ
jgi:peptidylprolyl isomerase